MDNKVDKSCDNCGNIDKYCDMFSNCINCMYDNNLHDNWQPKPSDKDQPENIDINCPHCGVEFVTAAEGKTIIKCPACEKALGKKEKPKDQPVDRDWTKAQETLREEAGHLIDIDTDDISKIIIVKKDKEMCAPETFRKNDCADCEHYSTCSKPERGK